MNNNHIVSVFDSEDTLLAAIHKLKEEKVKIADVYSPYPIHEVMEAMNLKTRFTFAAFLFGAVGATGILAFLYYTAVIDWPINYGGKPTNAFPSFIIVTIVLTILTITLASLFTFSARAKVYPGKQYILPDHRSMDDKFVLLIDMGTTEITAEKITVLLQQEGATEIHQKQLETIK